MSLGVYFVYVVSSISKSMNTVARFEGRFVDKHLQLRLGIIMNVSESLSLLHCHIINCYICLLNLEYI